ncbi:MAG: carboxypeptidase regulatory-like domain-containing protein [Candidatus Acidiferrales bacterium]
MRTHSIQRIFPVFFFFFAAIFGAASTVGQTRDLGAIGGQVTDPQGAVVVGAEVALTNASLNIERDSSTDAEGRYSFMGLPLTGEYSLVVRAPQFHVGERTEINLRAGVTADMDFQLALSGYPTQITVFGTAEGVIADSAQIADRLDQDKIESTPILNRQLTALPLLDSSVRLAQTTGDLFLNQTLFVINGSGRRQTTYSVDNTTGDDSWGRQTMFTSLPFSSVQEFTVLTNAMSAEYGRTTGAAVNVVTKSGTDQFHGDFIGMGRPAWPEASSPLAASRKAANTLAQGSGTFSGPLIRDRTYFLASLEYTQQNRDAVITSPVDPGAIYTGNAAQTLFLARLDHQLTDTNRLMLRANLDRLTDTNPQDSVSGATLPGAARIFKRDTYSVALADIASLGSHTVNEARFQFQLGSPITQFVPVTPGPQVFVSGYYTYGESRSANLMNHQFQQADTLTTVQGHHQLKAGFDFIESSSGGFGQEFGSGYVDGRFQINPAYETLPIAELLTYDPALAPPGLAPSAPPLALNFTQSFGSQNYNIKELLWAGFLQDNWNVRPGLSLNLGLRWEGQTFTNAHKNVGPRGGIAWQLPHLGSTILRAGYGIYYSEERIDLAASDILGGPAGVFTYTAVPGGLGFPDTFAPIAAFPPGASLPARDITIRPGECAALNPYLAPLGADVSMLHFCPNALLNPYTQQWNLGIEREIAPTWLLSVDYVGSHTIHIERPVDLNAPLPCDRTAPGQWCYDGAALSTAQLTAICPPGQATQTCVENEANATRPIAPVADGYRRIVTYANRGTAVYDGLQVRLNKRFSYRLSMLLSYTYSHSINTVEPDASSQDPNDSNFLGAAEKATSLLDQRHRASLSGNYLLPWGFSFGAFAQLGSGFPYNVTTGVDNNGDFSTSSDRPAFNGFVLPRDWGRGTPIYDTAMSLQKSLHISERLTASLRAEAFNVFNHANYYSRNGVYGNAATPVATFGQPVGGIANVGPGRQMQFMARFQF